VFVTVFELFLVCCCRLLVLFVRQQCQHLSQ